MSRVLLLLFILVAVGCSPADESSRHGFKDETEGSGSNNQQSEADDYLDIQAEKEDKTVRYISRDFELRYGNPGILYIVQEGNDIVRLIDISSGTEMEFATGTRMLRHNGVTVASDLELIQEDLNYGIFWYKGRDKDAGSTVLFVLQRI